jgi:hypothetical protein
MTLSLKDNWGPRLSENFSPQGNLFNMKDNYGTISQIYPVYLQIESLRRRQRDLRS